MDVGDVRPIFILGPGRSETTVLHRLLGPHPDLGWASTWMARFKLPQLALLSRVTRVTAFARVNAITYKDEDNATPKLSLPSTRSRTRVGQRRLRRPSCGRLEPQIDFVNMLLNEPLRELGFQ